jgi:TolB-like protein/Flp pilus assembly protein TadD
VLAQLAVANAQLAVAYSNFQSANNRQDMAGVERDLLALAEKAPQDFRVQRALGQTYRFLQRPEEALRAMQRALELSGGDPGVTADLMNVLMRRKRYAEAEAMIAPALARRPIGRMLVLDVFFKTVWRGDLAGAQGVLATWPGWLLREDRGAFIAWQTWMFSRRTDRALDVAERLPRDYLHDNYFTGPRAVLTARAHELAGHEAAAQADWRTVVRLADRELATEPDAGAALFWKAWAQSRLGDQAGAQAICTLLQQRGLTTGSFFKTTNLALLWSTLGRTDLAAEQLRASREVVDDAYVVTRPILELDPAYAPLRADPHYAELRDAAPAPASKPEDRGQKPEVSVPVDDKSVAVLAFANLSDDKANEYFSDGISEELLNVLAKIPGLKVSARTSAFYFKGKEVPVPEIARQLGVAYVVEGSVRKQGDKVRITAQLIKAEGGFHVWSDTFTRDLKDIFAVQDEIAALIAQNLELKLGVTAARPTIDVEAYQEYLAGRALVAKAGNADLQAAVGRFTKAVALEPKFTAAWVQLASAHTQLGRWGGAPTLQAWAAAHAAIERAVALEPDSPDVLLALGWIRRTADWDWRGAELAFRRALQLRPDHPETLAGAAILLYNIGKNEEAFRLSQQAVRLDPLNAATQLDLSMMYYLSGQYPEAERTARRALALAPGGAGYHSILAWGLIGQKRYVEAEAEARLDTDEIQQAVALGLVAIARGQTETARAQITRLEKLAQAEGDRADLQNNIAWIAAGLGEKDRAFAALEKAQALRDPSVSWLRNGTYLQLLFADPRWVPLLRKAGLADDQLK